MAIKVEKGNNGSVLSHPTSNGGGKSSILLVDIKSVSYKQVNTQRSKPNGDKVGKVNFENKVVFITGTGQYGVDCKSMSEAERVYNIIKELM